MKSALASALETIMEAAVKSKNPAVTDFVKAEVLPQYEAMRYDLGWQYQGSLVEELKAMPPQLVDFGGNYGV